MKTWKWHQVWSFLPDPALCALSELCPQKPGVPSSGYNLISFPEQASGSAHLLSASLSWWVGAAPQMFPLVLESHTGPTPSIATQDLQQT